MRFKGYLNKKLVGESVAEFNYQLNKCGREYRLVVVRKNISVQKGEAVLFEDLKYFFYITNHTEYSVEQAVALANGRCDQENVIERRAGVIETTFREETETDLFGEETVFWDPPSRH